MAQDKVTYNVPLKALDNPEPSIRIMNGGSVELMRISAEGVTVNPDIPVDEAAKYVIEALDSHIQYLLSHEREACAEIADYYASHSEAAKNISKAIRASGTKE